MRLDRAKTLVKKKSMEIEEEEFGDDFIPMNQSGIEVMKTKMGVKKNLIAKTDTHVEDTH
jgi:hypothetical protein